MFDRSQGYRSLLSRLVLIAVATAAAALVALPISLPFAVRLLGAVPLALMLPGLAIALALSTRWRFSRTEALLIVLGSSLAVSSLDGLVFGFVRSPSGSGVRIAIQVLVVAGGLLAAFLMRHQDLEPAAPASIPRLRGGDITAFAIAALLGLAAVGYASVVASDASQAVALQLWMVEAGDVGSGSVQLGVSNQQSGLGPYQLVLTDGDAVARTWDITFQADGRLWTTLYTPPPTAKTHLLSATLFSGAQAIREVRIQLPPSGPAG